MVKTGTSAKTHTKKHSLKKMSRRTRIILTVVAALFVVGGVAVWYNAQTSEKHTSVNERPLTQEEQRANSLTTAIVEGKDDNAALQQALDAAENDEQRADYYLEAAAYMAVREGATNEQKETALSYAEKAYELQPSLQSAKLALDIASELGREDVMRTYQAHYDGYMKDVDDIRQGAPE